MTEEEDIFENMEFEQSDTRYEIISMCNQALNAVEGFDTGMISKEDLQIGMMYDENF